MKLLIAVTSSQSYALVRGQISFMVKKGIDVVFVSSDDGAISAKIQAEGGRYRKIDIEREISLLQDIKSVFAAVKILRSEKPDIVNASTPKAGLIFMIACVFVRGVYPVFTLRGLRSDTLTGIKKRILKATEFITCKFAKKVIIISPSLREHAIDEGLVEREKTIVLGKGSSNGIDTRRFSISPEIRQQAKQIKADLAIPENGLVYGCLGRIVRDKGIAEVYQAFSVLRKKHDGIYLVLTGEREVGDPLSPEIIAEMEADPNVRFIGHASDVRSVLDLYDILILYSYREGFGNVVLEASSMEKPVIVADIHGARDTVEHNVTGFLSTPASHMDLADKMEKYLLDPALRNSHGKAGRERAVASFSSEIIWNKQYELYRSIQTNAK